MSKHRRHDIPQHLTASGMVLHAGHILLVHHKRIGAWVPPGGHVEADELPHETVIREILEETGVEVEVVAEHPPATADADAFFLQSPLYMQAVLAIEKGQRFYHLDLAYLCRPICKTKAISSVSASVQTANSETMVATACASVTVASDNLPALVANPEVKEARWVKIAEAQSLPLAKNVKEALILAETRVRELQWW